MKGKIREYIDRKFSIYPKSDALARFVESVYAAMEEKFDECRAYGMTERKSYELALEVMHNYKPVGNTNNSERDHVA